MATARIVIIAAPSGSLVAPDGLPADTNRVSLGDYDDPVQSLPPAIR